MRFLKHSLALTAVVILLAVFPAMSHAAVYSINLGGNSYTVEDTLKTTDSSGFGNTAPAGIIIGDSAATVTGAGGGLWGTRAQTAFSFNALPGSAGTQLEGIGDPDLTTTISGLPSGDYEVAIIAVHRNDGGGTWFTEADLNATPSTALTHATPGAIFIDQSGAAGPGQTIFGRYAHLLGTTGPGSTSFTVGIGSSAPGAGGP